MSKFDAADVYVPNSSCAPDGSWADVPGMSKTVKLGGTGARPILVGYSGNLIIDTQGSGGELRVLVDGGQVGLGSYFENNPDHDVELKTVEAFTVLSPALSPGNHTVEVQWTLDPGFNNGLCGNGAATLTVMHT